MNQQQFDETLNDPDAEDRFYNWRGNPVAKLFDRHMPSFHRTTLRDDLRDTTPRHMSDRDER